MKSKVGVSGQFKVVCRNPDGTIAWEDTIKNGVTNEGLNAELDIMFGATAKISAWYLGLIDSSGFTALAAADSASSHSGWSENTSDYSESTRPQWSPGSAASQSIANSTAVDFSVTGTVTLKGFFTVSDNTKGGSSGTLWATALFSSGDQSLVSGQTLSVTYTVSKTAS